MSVEIDYEETRRRIVTRLFPFNRREIAEMLNVSEKSVYNLLKGANVKIDLEMLVSLSDLFKCDIKEILIYKHSDNSKYKKYDTGFYRKLLMGLPYYDMQTIFELLQAFTCFSNVTGFSNLNNTYGVYLNLLKIENKYKKELNVFEDNTEEKLDNWYNKIDEKLKIIKYIQQEMAVYIHKAGF